MKRDKERKQMQDENYQHHFENNNNQQSSRTTMTTESELYSDDNTIYEGEDEVHFQSSSSSSLPTIEQVLTSNAINSRAKDIFDGVNINEDYADVHFGDGIIRRTTMKTNATTMDNNCNKSRQKKKYIAIVAILIVIATTITVTFAIMESTNPKILNSTSNTTKQVSKGNATTIYNDHDYDLGSANDIKKNITIDDDDSRAFTKPQKEHIIETNIDEKLAQIIRLVTIRTHTSTSHALSTTGTYQYQAAQWLAQYDTYIPNVPMDSEKKTSDFAIWQYVQRYVVVALFYALQGQNWYSNYNFLSPDKSICDWNDGISYGIFCNDDKEVTQFVLRTYIGLYTLIYHPFLLRC
jgi:hypothetical protein